MEVIFSRLNFYSVCLCSENENVETTQVFCCSSRKMRIWLVINILCLIASFCCAGEESALWSTQAAVHISADRAGEAGEMVHSLASLGEREVLVGNPGT